MMQARHWIIFLTLIALVLSALIIHQLYSYNCFLHARDERYQLAVRNLIAIREAQLAYKQKYGRYSFHLDSLKTIYDSIHKTKNFNEPQKNFPSLNINGKPIKITMNIKPIQQNSKESNKEFALKVSISKLDLLNGLPKNYIFQELSNQSPIPGMEIFFGSETNSSLAGNWNISFENTSTKKNKP